MAEIHVRNLPTELHERLQARARREGRSMSAEVVAILRSVLADDDLQERRTDAIARLRRIQQRHPLPPGAAPAEVLVREDREAR